MSNHASKPSHLRQKGQSLVEVALFLPIFVVILAGLIEVSQLVITQNRVSQAARVSSRFGANGGENDGMRIVALNSITQTLQMNEDVWDMWVVRGTVDQNGTAFEANSWEFDHIYGISNTVDYAGIDETAIQTEILNELNDNGNNTTLAAGTEIVGMVALHDVESILGLDGMPWLQGFYSIRGLSYMRLTGVQANQTNGCDAFPIAVERGIRSVTAPGSGGASEFPNNFTAPSPPPDYTDFPSHSPDVPLDNATEGDVFKIFQGIGSGSFGWLVWNAGISANANTLERSLTWPGDSLDYADHGDGGQPAAAQYNWVVRGYVNPNDSSDTSLHVGDLIATSTGVISASGVRNQLNSHVSTGRQLRVIVWDANDPANTGPGSNGRYKVHGFAIFRLHGYRSNSGQGGPWILAEFIRWDTSCGQPTP
ncbi:MAG: pilus assembly protein [Anaerolineales bacterium]|nr:pilus assembly protein [Anaerolineales bacterium]